MSVAKDEADDGQDLSSDDDGQAGSPFRPNERGESKDDDIPTPTVSNANGYRLPIATLDDNVDLESSAEELQDQESELASQAGPSLLERERPSSADGSLSIPDDTPSLQGSLVSSSPGRGTRSFAYGRSPTPSLQPFDRRFKARVSSSPFNSPRASSPAFLNIHSRQSSAAFMEQDIGEDEKAEAPWEVVRWTKLRKMTGQALSEVGRRNFGRPTCIAVAASIVLGTNKGIILVFDYNQNLKSIIGPGTKSLESGSITSVSISADHSTIAAGHASGNIFTWEIAKSAKPFLHIPPTDRSRHPNADGHVSGVAILHIGFLGMRHTALASADDQGMAFSHLATRGIGVVARSVKTVRILGRYPDNGTDSARQRKPSSVLSFSSLPLGNAEHTADALGLVGLLTPYLLVIVSTTPVAQTQYKAPRPKEVAAHGAMTAALAWFPSVKLKSKMPGTDEDSSRVKLVYCWSNILTVLEVMEVESSVSSGKAEPVSLQFKPRSRWKAEEAIVGVQWLGRSVLAVLTITQQLIILEDPSMMPTDSSDLIQKHIYHADLFSPQLNQLVDRLDDEEGATMHGVVADAFYMSFRAYKGRLFLLGFNEVSFGTLSNWADRLLALMEDGSYIGAIQLATSYFNGDGNKAALGLPQDDHLRHSLVQEKLLGMMSASLKYAFGKGVEAKETRIYGGQMAELSSACITACNSLDDHEFLFDEVYGYYDDAGISSMFIESLEPYISSDDITIMPPVVLKDLVRHYTQRDQNTRLEEILCHLDPRTMDIDQITTLCREHFLYNALLYIWDRGLSDRTTIVGELLSLADEQYRSQSDIDPMQKEASLASASNIFPYLSYILTSRIYPTGKVMADDSAILAKAEIYHYFFSGNSKDAIPKKSEHQPPPKGRPSVNFPNLRKILDFDAPSFLSMLNEAFEDGFLNGPADRLGDESPGQLTEEQKFGLSVNRQWVVSVLLDVMTPPNYGPEDTIYLDMFIARNVSKFRQYVLLPGHDLHRVLVGLCQYPSEDVAQDCQLSVEYLLSMYQPPDLSSLIPLILKARFYRVLKSIYKAGNNFPELLRTCFDDRDNIGDVFDCIRACLKPSTDLHEDQKSDFRQVIIDHAYDLVAVDVLEAASTIDEYAPDLHCVVLKTIDEDRGAQYAYLRAILEPREGSTEEKGRHTHQRDFIEQYVRLLCEFDPSHVSGYIERLENRDLRLGEVLPALENSHVVDAAVILMARDGRVREGIDRLTRHLDTLESILLGVVEGANESPDIANTSETGQDLIRSIQRYARVGSWICRRQTKVIKASKPTLSRAQSARALKESLSVDEELWLDLTDAVVKVTKNVTEVLERQERRAFTSNTDDTRKTPESSFDSSQMITNLRLVVQDVFTDLLAATSAENTKDSHHSDASFLQIFRAFLSRASLSSPSLSNLRAVLSTIFSAYSHEEALLTLANRLLDKDLFVHIRETDTLRRKGWRPLGQVCEGCGKKIWGPGAGGHIWDAWQQRNEDSEKKGRDRQGHPTSRSSSREGKGKAVTRRDDPMTTTEQNAQIGNETSDEHGPVVIFSCRHMFHRACLEKIHNREATVRMEDLPGEANPDLTCPLCK